MLMDINFAIFIDYNEFQNEILYDLQNGKKYCCGTNPSGGRNIFQGALPADADYAGGVDVRSTVPNGGYFDESLFERNR